MGALRQPYSTLASPSPGVRNDAIGSREAELRTSGLKILHILRAPVGGLFRHVLDVARGQAERGHRVGLIADSTTGGERAEAMLAQLAPQMALGVKRVAIPRQLGPNDFVALGVVARHIARMAPDVLHGHGAKGAALARLAPRPSGAISVYTPHGGSLVYAAGAITGGFYTTLEWFLNRRTDLFLFESDYIARQFVEQVGPARGVVRVVRNGLSEDEFAAVTPRDDATDFVCVGELRDLKGFDVLLAALAELKRSGRTLSVTFAGEGSYESQLRSLTQHLGVADHVRFVGHRPAREAFAMGRVFVVPSRAESLPYVVLEAAAAGIPIVATRVGGIPEIFGAEASHLIAPDNVAELVSALVSARDNPTQAQLLAAALKTRVRREFSLRTMVDDGLAAYREVLATRKAA
jgi:glycosyltransferase involved in cell wall biosynthesis